MKPETPRQRYGYLPAPLMAVLEAAGEDAMLRLVMACGGTRLHLGRTPRDGGLLASAVGIEAATAIQSRFAADSILHIDVPRMSITLSCRRVQRIVELRKEGLKVADVARQLGMTERGVYAACRRIKEDTANDRQLDLFA